jgi:cell division protein FtsL
MSAISKETPVTLSQSWGADFCDYKLKNTPVDFQDLMIAISENRAVAVESEVTPLTTRIRDRNKKLDDLGNVLADLTKLQAMFPSDASGDTRKGTLKDESYTIICRLFPGEVDFNVMQMTKYEVEEWMQKVKSKIDGLNNESQTDMTRLQSLVDRRDESFSTASNLMSTISDTRSNLIRNL